MLTLRIHDKISFENDIAIFKNVGSKCHVIINNPDSHQ